MSITDSLLSVLRAADVPLALSCFDLRLLCVFGLAPNSSVRGSRSRGDSVAESLSTTSNDFDRRLVLTPSAEVADARSCSSCLDPEPIAVGRHLGDDVSASDKFLVLVGIAHDMLASWSLRRDVSPYRLLIAVIDDDFVTFGDCSLLLDVLLSTSGMSGSNDVVAVAVPAG